MDALLNFETVALCGNGGLEVRQYDSSLSAYQVGGGLVGGVGGLAALQQVTSGGRGVALAPLLES